MQALGAAAVGEAALFLRSGAKGDGENFLQGAFRSDRLGIEGVVFQVFHLQALDFIGKFIDMSQ
ncbi:hypothetical protein D3C75_1349850 [compost metagenome]